MPGRTPSQQPFRGFRVLGGYEEPSSGSCLSQAVLLGFGLKRPEACRYSLPVRRTILCLCLLSSATFSKIREQLLALMK